MSLSLNAETIKKVRKAIGDNAALEDDFIDAVQRARKVKQIAGGLSAKTIDLVGGAEVKINCEWNPKAKDAGVKVKMEVTKGSVTIPPDGTDDSSEWIDSSLLDKIESSYTDLSAALADLATLFVDADLIKEDIEAISSSSDQDYDWWIGVLRSEL